YAKRLIAELSMSQDQQRQLASIMEDSRREFLALRESGLPPDQVRNRSQAIRARAGERITAILTPEQQPRYAELRAEARTTTAAVSGRVWIVGADGQPQPLPVRLGIGDGTVTEIVAGDLKAGQEVIVGGGAKAGGPTGPGPRLGF